MLECLHMEDLYDRLRKSRWARSLDSYRSDGGFEELQKLLQKNPRELYDFYGDGQAKGSEATGDLAAWFSTAKSMFLSFLTRLNPARRVAYLIALAAFAWGLYSDEWTGAGISFGILTFLLALELAEKLLTKDELEIARAIQFSLQPDESPRLHGLDVARHFQPAKDVGGDYYDYSVGGDGRFTIIIGDVSGKGMPAALYAMKLQALFALLGKREESPKTILTTMNDVLGTRLARSYFITAAVGVVDTESKTLLMARAGHNHPLLFRASSGQILWLKPEGMGIGMKAGPVFDELLAEERTTLQPGDVLLFYTDGVSEAMNPANRIFGEQKLGSIIAESSHRSAAEIKDSLLASLSSHRDGEPLADDLTFVVVRVDPSISSS